MAFFTSFSFYRPSTPPPVTGDNLSQFIAQICDTNTLEGSGLNWLNVKFGESIDQDARGTTWEEETSSGMLVSHSIEWDISLSGSPTRQEMIAALAGDQSRVYRASVSLGMPTDDVLRPFTRMNSVENEIDLVPDTLSIDVGPIKSFNLSSENSFRVGWISLNLSGYGYLFPWTFQDVFDRLSDSSEIQRLTQVCRSFWPVPPEPPAAQIIAVREEMGDLWPDEQLDLPWDWFWGLRESG